MWLPCFGIVAGLAILVLLCASLPYMSIATGIVRAVALQQIDNAPHAEASAESNNKGLQSSDSGSEKLHIFLHFSGVIAPAMKKAARCGRQVTASGHFVSK